MAETIGYPEILKASDVDLLVTLRERLEFAKRSREFREEVWRQSERQYVGKHWTKTAVDDPTADLATVNVSFGTVNTIVPHVAGEEPRFIVEPYGAGATMKNARLLSWFLNRQWRDQRVGATAASRAAVYDRSFYGDGFLKVTYDITERPLGLDEIAEVAELYVDRLDPWDVWMDPHATSLEDAEYVIHRIWIRKDIAKEDESLANLKDEAFTSRSQPEDTHSTPNTHDLDSDEWIELYEFYSIPERTLVVFSDYGDMPHSKRTGVTPPISNIPGYEIPHSPWHMGDLEQIWPIQQELNKTRSQLMTHRRRNVAKVLVKKEALTPEAEDAMASAIVGQFVPIEGDQPLDGLVHPMNLQPISGEMYASSQQAMDDIYEISGVTQYHRGSAPDITRTATEASIMEGSSNVKLRHIVGVVEEAMRRCGTLLLSIAKDVFPETDVDEMEMFIGGTEAQRVNEAALGEEAMGAMAAGDVDALTGIGGMDIPAEASFIPNEEVFQGTYEVHVVQGSTEFRNPMQRFQRLQEMLTLLLQNSAQLQQLGVGVDFSKLMKLWLESSPDLKEVDEIIGAAQQPVLPPGSPQGDGAAPMDPELAGMMQGLMNAAPPGQVTPDNSGMPPPR